MKSISNIFTRKKRCEKLISTKVGSHKRTYIDKTDEHYYYSWLLVQLTVSNDRLKRKRREILTNGAEEQGIYRII